MLSVIVQMKTFYIELRSIEGMVEIKREGGATGATLEQLGMVAYFAELHD